ncbi:MAG: hypothetical protein ACFB0B_15270 [Thermonemataceae bacterium]
MKYTDYASIIEKQLPQIKPENLLFWNLWCLNYVFEKITTKEYKYYKGFQACFDLLWEMNDTRKIDVRHHPSVKALLSFTDEEYEDLDDFEVNQKAIKECLVGLESILKSLFENNSLPYSSYTHPIDLIDIIVDQIHIDSENTHPAFLTEAQAQFKMLEEITRSVVYYTRKECNRHRM